MFENKMKPINYEIKINNYSNTLKILVCKSLFQDSIYLRKWSVRLNFEN